MAENEEFEADALSHRLQIKIRRQVDVSALSCPMDGGGCPVCAVSRVRCGATGCAHDGGHQVHPLHSGTSCRLAARLPVTVCIDVQMQNSVLGAWRICERDAPDVTVAPCVSRLNAHNVKRGAVVLPSVLLRVFESLIENKCEVVLRVRMRAKPFLHPIRDAVSILIGQNLCGYCG